MAESDVLYKVQHEMSKGERLPKKTQKKNKKQEQINTNGFL